MIGWLTCSRICLWFAIEASYVEASWYDYRRACCKIKNCEIESEIPWGQVPFTASPVACGVLFYLRGGAFFLGGGFKIKKLGE